MNVRENITKYRYESKVSFDNRLKWREDENRLCQQFEQDLYEEHELENHPKKEEAFRIAWELGHSSGLSEVEMWFTELAGLMK